MSHLITVVYFDKRYDRALSATTACGQPLEREAPLPCPRRHEIGLQDPGEGLYERYRGIVDIVRRREHALFDRADGELWCAVVIPSGPDSIGGHADALAMASGNPALAIDIEACRAYLHRKHEASMFRSAWAAVMRFTHKDPAAYMGAALDLAVNWYVLHEGLHELSCAWEAGVLARAAYEQKRQTWERTLDPYRLFADDAVHVVCSYPWW